MQQEQNETIILSSSLESKANTDQYSTDITGHFETGLGMTGR